MVAYRVVLRVIGFLLILLAVFLLVPSLVSWFHGESVFRAFLLSSLISFLIGVFLFLLHKSSDGVRKREGYLIVSGGWLAMTLLSAIPYMLSGELTDFASAFFESASGLTTTGATVFEDIESLPRGILVWRSMTQWLGGMGIIVLSVAIFPLLGIGGVELFVAEAPGPSTDKLHPRIKDTAKRLWLIYFGLTVLLAVILWFYSGMSLFDAVNHALTTMSTGGFSTKNDSIAHFGPAVQYPIIVFMFLAGLNYTIIYFGLKGQFRRVWRSDEFRAYLWIILCLILLVGFSVRWTTGQSTESAFRDAAFQLISVLTTTGYVSADYTTWGTGIVFLFFMLLFVGACAGSTSGGIKIIRHLVLFKNTLLEFKRLLHPRAMIRTKIDGQIVNGRVITHILVFLVSFLGLFIVGSIFMSIILADVDQALLTAMGSVATCLGNVGPAIGSVGPMDNFSDIPQLGKLFLSFYMIIGRLELFTILIVFSPHFWRSN